MTDLQERITALRDGRAVLPLTDREANAQAVRLRMRGMRYTEIAVVMDVYHGQRRDHNYWRRTCRARGVAPDYHRGGYHQKVSQ